MVITLIKYRDDIQKILEVLSYIVSTAFASLMIGEVYPPVVFTAFIVFWVTVLCYGIYDKLYYKKHGIDNELRITTLNDESGAIGFYVLGGVISLLGIISIYHFADIGYRLSGVLGVLFGVLIIWNTILSLPSCLLKKIKNCLAITGLEENVETGSIISIEPSQEKIKILLTGDREYNIRNLVLTENDISQVIHFFDSLKASK